MEKYDLFRVEMMIDCCEFLLRPLDRGFIFKQERDPLAELNDEAWPELAREINFDETDLNRRR